MNLKLQYVSELQTARYTYRTVPGVEPFILRVHGLQIDRTRKASGRARDARSSSVVKREDRKTVVRVNAIDIDHVLESARCAIDGWMHSTGLGAAYQICAVACADSVLP